MLLLSNRAILGGLICMIDPIDKPMKCMEHGYVSVTDLFKFDS